MTAKSIVHTTQKTFGPFEAGRPNATLTVDLRGGSLQIEVAHGPDQWLLSDTIEADADGDAPVVLELRVAQVEFRITPLGGATFTFTDGF